MFGGRGPVPRYGKTPTCVGTIAGGTTLYIPGPFVITGGGAKIDAIEETIFDRTPLDEPGEGGALGGLPNWLYPEGVTVGVTRFDTEV